ncbi:amino acid ABC transporter substrate-binding protein [Alteromonas sp. A079]|uniref:amino acid ABC transporter substrate-binding protein n=1 Tax=Alteromonas sp. A079 TaxID=3410268 RepID=UPI003BA356B9
MHKITYLLIGVVLLVGLPASSNAALWTITYPRALDDTDTRNEYPTALLKLALDKTGVNYEMRPSDRILLTGKAMRQLRENREVNVVWSMTDTQREKDLLPIRIPITKGLIGLRVFVIEENRRSQFDNVATKQDLLSLVPLQGEEWPDTKILQANGFNVSTVPEFKEGYEMLALGRGDFFPRSVTEVTAEFAEMGKAKNLQLESSLVMYYPTAMYFFVSKSNPILAKLIETGLQRAVDDGSFDVLFAQTYRKTLKDLNIPDRTLFTLENPLLPPKTPLSDERLWYFPN